MTISTYVPIDDPSQLKDIRLRMLLAHWAAAASGGRPPTKDIVDPVKFGDLMGWLFLYRVEREPMRFRYLLYGPKIARRIGFDLTGKYVDEHPLPEAREAIGNLLTAVATTARPHRGESRRVMLDQMIMTEAVVLPLAGPEGVVDHLLALQIYETPSDG
ncbi:MAG: PAS domain-containing protein [Rhodospirillaceae bacterium]|nr:PAS domain-containing protein [Rhodospirillaceae bacterium]